MTLSYVSGLFEFYHDTLYTVHVLFFEITSSQIKMIIILRMISTIDTKKSLVILQG